MFTMTPEDGYPGDITATALPVARTLAFVIAAADHAAVIRLEPSWGQQPTEARKHRSNLHFS